MILHNYLTELPLSSYVMHTVQMLRIQHSIRKISVLAHVVKYSAPATKAAHYTDVIMGTIASQIISLTIVYSTVC